jgi:hypothetical protein
VDPSYNSPLLRRASAARAPGTNSFNDVVDHIAALQPLTFVLIHPQQPPVSAKNSAALQN